MPSMDHHFVERRAWPRLRQKIRVWVSDPADVVEEPYAGWIVDHSDGGLCLTLDRQDIEVGSILLIQSVSTPSRSATSQVRVNNRRRKENQVEFGCEFVPPR